MQEITINWLALILAVLLRMALGAVWFSPPLFLKPWLAVSGVSEAQIEDAAKYLAAQPRHHPPPDVAHEECLGEVAETPQDEEAHDRERHPDDRARVALLQRRVAKELGEHGEARLRSGVEDRAQHPDCELQAVRPCVAEQAPVGPEGASGGGSRRRVRTRGGAHVVQGLPAGSSLTVATLISAKPRRPSTSMAVMTDW